MRGLKENVIIGKLIPAGTGLNKFKNTRISTDEESTEEATEQEQQAETVAAQE